MIDPPHLRSSYRFSLPPELIARHPAPAREGSRLMDLFDEGPPHIGPFSRVLERFRGDEVLVVNDTRVVPARIYGHKSTGGAIELLIVEVSPDGRARAMARGRLRPGASLALPGGVTAEVEATGDAEGLVTLRLQGVGEVWAWLEMVGELPLPPYLGRAAEAEDRERYQTVFARVPGAVAAPTAGLHFTPALLDALRGKGVTVCAVTLHVGPGTFRPVQVDDVRDHVMHAERFVVPAETAAAVASGRPVVAVGTTVVRALEAHALDARADRTNLFIRPGFAFRVVDGLLTNFHLPESTLLMLVSAFAGRERVLAAYAAAVEARMRFFSYGDAMLLRRRGGRWT